MCKNPNLRFLTRLLVDVFILLCVSCGALVVLPKTVHTFERGFFCSDDTLMYPYVESMLSKVHMTIVIVAIPAVLVLIVEMLRAALQNDKGKQQFAFVGIGIPTFISECYKVIGAYLFGISLVVAAVQTTKHLVGRLRPYFFDVCQPRLLDGTTCEHMQNQGAYLVNYTCSELSASSELLKTVRHSFPSGYAANTAYAMFFLVFYLQARMTTAWLRLARTALQFCFATIAYVVALERVSSLRNHWSDALVGFVVGLSIAAFVSVCLAKLYWTPPLRKRRSLKDKNPIYAYSLYGFYGLNKKTPKYF
ncbi:putative phosphatidate phosphatase [Teleopsis dalmanni]|uniref:putative phosphatidate phosphatase n=1 Tax=Teleopsis dalmanni TaxID=139649 RepID=UPI0018CDA9EF|nr:putative phosphatidate phosphatase [Teleopsis dalmanni]